MLVLCVRLLVLSLVVGGADLQECTNPELNPDGLRPSSGVQLYNQNTKEVLQNNSVVTVNQMTVTKGIICISDATNIDYATWIHPSNMTVTLRAQSQSVYVVMVQRLCDGLVELQHRGSLPFERDHGVYTCRIRDGNGTIQTLYIGFYGSDEDLKPPEVSHLLVDYSSETGMLKLDCVTTAGPPTSLTWSVNGSEIASAHSEYRMTQWLVNGSSATYHNLLYIDGQHTGEYRCLATNTVGNRTHSIWIVAPVQNVSAVPQSSTSVLVSWLPPPLHQNGVITSYYLNFSSDGEYAIGGSLDVDASQTMVVVEGLEEFVKYYFVVGVAAPEGVGPYTVVTSTTTFQDAPSAPAQNVSAIAESSTSVMVTWKPPPLKDQNGVITSYHLNFSSDGEFAIGGSLDVDASQTMVVVEGLEEFVKYYFVVGVAAPEGVGPYTVVTSTTTFQDAPSAPPQNVSATAQSSTSVMVTWKPPPLKDQNGVITSYHLTFSWDEVPQIGRSIDINASERMTVVKGLEGFVKYDFVVAAVTSEGVGPYSNITTAATFQDDENGSTFAGIIAGVGAGCLVVIMTAIMVILAVVFCRNKKHKVAPTHELILLTGNTEPDCVTEVCISDFPDDSTASLGESVVLHVQVHGEPTPTLTWFHDEKDVSSDRSVNIKEDGTLVIPTMEHHHAGTYRLDASNEYSSACREVTLSVEEDEEEESPYSPLGIMTQPPVSDNKAVPMQSFQQFVTRHHINNNQPFQFQFMCLSATEKEALVGSSQENETLNRSKRIVPYDDNRIILNPLPECEKFQLGYINASRVDGYKHTYKFIATQGPLPHTVMDFWRMVWQEQCSMIIMLCKVKEANKLRCQQYWPIDKPAYYGPFCVTLLSSEQTNCDYVIRTLEVKLLGSSTDLPLTVIMFHYTSWPEHGIPDYAGPLLSFRKDAMKRHRNVNGPILVHCSNGVGRTGVFIALDTALEQAQEEEAVDINGIISRIRQQRMKMVQTLAQYVFIYDSVLEWLMCGETRIPSYDLCISRRHLSRADGNGQTGFAQQFQVLQVVTPQPLEEERNVARQHPHLNRSLTYAPRDQRRVVLAGEGVDYIHATYIDGYKRRKAFIIAESPMRETSSNFWRMVYQQKCGAIVMLCEASEVICHPYWRSDTYGDYTIDTSELHKHNVITRTITLTNTKVGTTRTVKQFQVLNWTSDGKCSNHGTVAELLCEVMDVHGSNPIVVHCSDTVGRSGIFCATATAVEHCKAERVVDVYQAVKVLRMQKPGSIITVEQYEVIFDMVLAYFDACMGASYANNFGQK